MNEPPYTSWRDEPNFGVKYAAAVIGLFAMFLALAVLAMALA